MKITKHEITCDKCGNLIGHLFHGTRTDIGGQMKAIIKMFGFEKEVEIFDFRPAIYLPIALSSPVSATIDAIGGEVKRLVFDLVRCESGIARYELNRKQENKIIEAI